MFYLRIGTDPTTWSVTQEGAVAAVAQELAQATAPVVLPVNYPLIGTLVLSARSAGAVWLAPPGAVGSHPTGATLPVPLIYVPSATAATVGPPGGHPLAPGTNLAQLQQDIVTAMTNGAMLTVPLAGGLGATLVLSGASLAYAVLCPAA